MKIFWNRKDLLISVVYGAVSFLWLFLVAYLGRFLDVKPINQLGSMSMAAQFFVAVVVVPIFETFMFQYLPIHLIIKNSKYKYKDKIAIISSAILFGLAHFYSLYHILIMLIPGYILANRFYIYYKKHNDITAVVLVSIIHSISNFLTFAVKSNF